MGIKAPGGVIVRTDLEGSFHEVMAGGLRNAYDLVFNHQGDLFVHDSDMEWDEGLTWHRPTRLLHIMPGADFGWRSGWAKWPEYYPDNMPSLLETGAGSPTGITIYDHDHYPAKYRNRLFLTDWANGKLMTVQLKRSGAGYEAKSEVFLIGDPLTVTDLEVGPDGMLYFCSGGRGTEGGLYRISYKGENSDQQDKLGTGIAAAVQQPQPHSAWGRQKIATIQHELGEEWDKLIQGVVIAKENEIKLRTRALDLMQLYGPTPKLSFLFDLTEDPVSEIRFKAIDLLALYEGDRVNNKLIELLDDRSPIVRRRACELLAEREVQLELKEFKHCLTAEDRREIWAARRLLEVQPLDSWFTTIIKTDDPHLFNHGAITAMVGHPDKARALQICKRAEALLGAYVSDADFRDMLRVIQLALHQGELQQSELPSLSQLVANEFPAADHLMNRELIRILAYFKDNSIVDRYIAYLESDVPQAERLHLAMHLTFIQEGWSTRQKLQLLGHLEKGLEIEGGEGLRGYVEMSTKRFVKTLTNQEKYIVLSMGHLWPNAALATLFEIAESPDRAMLDILVAVDKEIAGRQGKVVERLRDGIIALIAESGEEDLMQYLRDVFYTEPERRAAVAFGLAQHPEGENYQLLLESIPILEGKYAKAVLTQLQNTTEVSERPEDIRNLLLLGLKLQEDGGHSAIRVLEKWTGNHLAKNEVEMEKRLEAWQTWFAENYPELPAAELPDHEKSNWDLKQLLDFVSNDDFHGGNKANGKLLFGKAKCADCHRHGAMGEAVGPDLTTISRRFQKKQILESILFPSHVISSQYAAKKILTLDGKMHIGLVTSGIDNDLIVVTDTGEKVSIPEADIEEIADSKLSVMPSGLIDQLTAAEIADLLTFLGAVPEADESTETIAEQKISSRR